MGACFKGNGERYGSGEEQQAGSEVRVLLATGKSTMQSRNWIWLGAVLVAAVLVDTDCHRPEHGKLDGDVFIVTEGAANVKLGLVEVRVLPYEETKRSIAQTKAQADQEIAALQPKLDAARKAVGSAEARYRALGRESMAAVNRIEGENYEAAYDAATAVIDREAGAQKGVGSAKREVLDLEEQVRAQNSGARYFANLPSPLVSVKSDADGKFSMQLDSSATVVLAAHATRQVVGKAENYYWLVPVSLDGQPSKRIFLSNDNLATSDSKDSLVHVVE